MQTATLHPDVRLHSDPVTTPEKFRSGHCHLELTPVWQYVIKKKRFPANVDRQEVFSELAVRLQHPEWQVRLHGSRVLAYIVPAVGPQLDALMSPIVLPAVITNLAHFSPALRSSSMDAILVYVQHSLDPEFVLKSMIVQGLDVPGAKSSLTVNVMECVPVVLQQIVKRNGERPVAIPTFVHLVTALSNKMVQATFQQAAVYCLDRVKEIVGRNKFDHYLETFHPIIKKDFEVLCEVYRISSSSGQDSSVSSCDDEDDVEIPKTPRRVTFGGELIKIRSPDVSDDLEVVKPTGIPIPIKPALSLPKHPKDEINSKSTKLSPSHQRNYKNMKMDKSIKNIESSAKISKATFSVTVVPETRSEPPQSNGRDTVDRGQQQQAGEDPSAQSGDQHKPLRRCSDSRSSASGRAAPAERSPDRDGAISDRDAATNDGKKPGGDLQMLSVNGFDGFARPNVLQLQYAAGTVAVRPPRNDKPVAEVKPTTSVVQPQEERRRSHLQEKQEKRPSEIGSNFTPFNDPQKALQLTSAQINSSEWEAAVTGLQNISRLSMFHGRELRPSSLQPFARPVAKHIKSLRSQVARAACTAMQKMFSYVPKSAEPDVEEIASALFPRTADTNKFLRVQSADALNSMVDNVNPVKCVHVITSKGIKHGNRLVRAEACRLLARVVDKLGVSGTLHLPVDSRDAVITAATSMVFDNTPTSRQAAQHILAKLSKDPRGAALISSAASPNVKATLNKSLSRIFLK